VSIEQCKKYGAYKREYANKEPNEESETQTVHMLIIIDFGDNHAINHRSKTGNTNIETQSHCKFLTLEPFGDNRRLSHREGLTTETEDNSSGNHNPKRFLIPTDHKHSLTQC